MNQFGVRVLKFTVSLLIIKGKNLIYKNSFDSLDKLPSITFRYEFDGISMRYSPSSGSMTTLVISILAIIGGIFAVSNLGSKIL